MSDPTAPGFAPPGYPSAVSVSRPASKPGAKGKRGTAPTDGGTDQGDSVFSRDSLFDDGKDAGALRTIGEVGRALGLRQHVMRYWEEQFPMLRPLTRAGGRRYYRPEDIALLREIDLLVHHQGYTIRGARQALEMRGRASRRSPVRQANADAANVPASGPILAGVSLVGASLAGASLVGASSEIAPELAMLGALAALREHLDGIRQRIAAALGAS